MISQNRIPEEIRKKNFLVAPEQRGSRWARAGQVSGYYGVAMDTRGALDVPGQAMCQVTMELLCKEMFQLINYK